MTDRIITIFGSGRTKADDPAWALAAQTGKVLAQSGLTIANGGYGGTMLAAAQAARNVGGRTIGVTCSAFGQNPANQYISQEIQTKTLDQRLDKLIELGDAYVVLPGGTGTLLELAKVWELKNKGFLPAEKPIILLGSYFKPLVELIEDEDPKSSHYLNQVDSPEQIRDILKDWL
jgi:uncharacterized protein (TIGR00730 family)